MKPITPESIYAFVELSDVRIAPDGSAVAFVRTSADRVSNANHRSIWLQSLTSDTPAEPLSSGTKDTMPRWSPDGKRLAFLSGRDDKPAIFVLPAHGEARKIATHPNGIGGFAWSPDGARIAYTAASRASERAKEDDPPAEPDERTAFERKQDKERHEYAEQERSDPRVITRVPYRDGSGTSYLEDRWSQLYVIDVPGSFAQPNAAQATRLTSFDANHTLPSWAKDGESLYSTLTREPDNPRLYAYHDVVRISSREPGSPVRLTSEGHSCYNPRVSPDGRWVAFERVLEDKLLHRVTTLAIMPAAGGDPFDLTAGVDRNVVDVVWGPDSRSIYFTLEKDGAVNLWRASVPNAVPLDAELRSANIPTNIRGRLIDDLGLSPRLLTALKRAGVRTVGELTEFQARGESLPEDNTLRVEQLTEGAQHITSFDVSADGRVVYAVSTAGDPSALMVRDTDGAIYSLYQPNKPALGQHAVAKIEAFSYPSDAYTIQGWLVKPPDFDPANKYPLIVNIHGGPHLQWNAGYPSLFIELQSLAQRGYLVFFCNPRGSAGYGEAFMAANWRDWGDGPMRDVMTGVDLLLERGYVDENRLYVTGGSYGGYLTAWIVGHTDRFRAAVAQRGVYNLISIRNTSDIPFFFDFEFGLTPSDDADALWRHSPLAYADAINTPLLIEHSENDYRCPIEQAEQMFQALSVSKKTVTLVRWPREGHELSRAGEPRHRIGRLERMLEWFDRFGG